MSDSGLDNGPVSPLPEDSHSPDDRDSLPPTAADPNLDMDDLDYEKDVDSDLSEVDEAEFADFDPTTVALQDRPIAAIDEEVARTLKAGKRKRTDNEVGPKKPKEVKRDKPKKKKPGKNLDHDAINDGEDEYDSGADGEIIEGKRKTKAKSVRIEGDRKDRERAEKIKKIAQQEENEESLTPEERRKRALDRAMDAALKNPNKRRRKKDEVVCLFETNPVPHKANFREGPRGGIR